MELNNKLRLDILSKLEKYAFTLNKVLETKQGNILTRKAIKIEYESTIDIIKLLKENGNE